MGVRFARRIARRMRVLMMLVMIVEIFVFHWLVDMRVFVLFGDVKPNAQEHENARCEPVGVPGENLSSWSNSLGWPSPQPALGVGPPNQSRWP
jgi:hypothetical protein